MRQNAARMRQIASMHPAQSVTQIAKQMLTFDGNKTYEYSFNEDLQKCRRAVIRAINWRRKDVKRFAIKLRQRKTT